MNEYTAKHFRETAARLRNEYTGVRITLRWLAAHSATYDQSRDEYADDGAPTYFEESGVPALIYEISAAAIAYGRWGRAEVGDLIVGISPTYSLDGKEDLRVVYQNLEYLVVPESDIPKNRLAGIVGDVALFTILHCRLAGKKAGLI